MQAKLGTLTTIDERLSKLETSLENRNEHEEECDINHNERDGEYGPLIQYEGQNVRDLDDQYLNSVKLVVPSFDGRLDPQLFLEWFRHMDKYFTWYQLYEARKVKFVAMKLTDQAIVESMRASRL